MKNLKVLKFALVLFIVFLSSVSSSNAQYTYVGADLNYNLLSIESKELGISNTNIVGADMQLQLFFRPLRFAGFGVSLSVPAFQRTNYYLSTDDENFSYDSEFDDEPTVTDFGFRPTSFNYDLEREVFTTIFSRIFVETEYNAFLEIRYSFLKVNEKYNFVRPEGTLDFSSTQIPAAAFNWNEDISLRGLGFAVGIMPMIGDYFYYHSSVSVDVLNASSPGFTDTIATRENSSNSSIQYSSLSSGLNSRNTFWRLNVGFGLFF